MHSVTGSQWYAVLLAKLYLGFVSVGFRSGQAVFIFITVEAETRVFRPHTTERGK